ncbi:helix-turn-helix domain-containing protein [Breznakia sp. OttesenSCG-928-G09]|nr:helix-turn-helix domain-containing protein [Breznakia sp. OttesenSCG-928-G09]
MPIIFLLNTNSISYFRSIAIYFERSDSLYKKFLKLLKKKNVTVYQLSKDTGISQSTLSDWKRGVSTPKIDKLQILANYFGVPIEYFLK